MKNLMKSAIATAIISLTANAYANAPAAPATPAPAANPAPSKAAPIVATPAPAAPAAPTAVSTAEREKIEGIVHDYLLKKPEVLVEALQILQRKQYEQAEQTVKQTQQTAANFFDQLFHQTNDPFAGNAKGKVTVVEFFDYQCPHCIDMAPTIANVLKANKDVKIIFKEFPIRGPMSDFAARAALAANKQGKYYAFSHALLSTTKPLTQDSILQMAKDVKLNVDQLKKDMNDKAVDGEIKANIKLAQDLKLFGTPAFFIGKSDSKDHIEYVPGQVDEKQLQKMIDDAAK